MSIAAPLLFTACQQNVKTEENVVTEVKDETTPEDTTSWELPKEVDNRPLNVKIDALADSVDRSFKNILKNESDKFSAIKSVLDNVKLIKGFTQFAAVSKIQIALKETEKLRITKDGITDGVRMTQYDKKTEELIKLLQSLYDASNQFEGNSSAVNGANEAFKSDQNDLFVRKEYSKFVRDYNDLLNNNKEAIKNLGEKYQKLTPAQDFKYADNV